MFELLDPLLVALLEPALELLELLELVFDAPPELEDELLDVTELAVAEALCVSPHAPKKTPIVAAATPARRFLRAASRAAAGRRAPPAEIGRGAATCRPAVASVTSPCGSATQLST